MAQVGTEVGTRIRNTKKRIRARNWAFTLNNHTRNEMAQLSQVKCKRILFQEETGAEGTPHLQGLIQFEHAKDFNAVKAMIGSRAHLEICRNVNASINYVTKEETRTGIQVDEMPLNEEKQNYSQETEDKICKWGLLENIGFKTEDIENIIGQVSLNEVEELVRARREYWEKIYEEADRLIFTKEGDEY